MALVLLRSQLKFNKVCKLYGTSRNICGLRLPSMGDKSNCVPQLLTPTRNHWPLALFKRHQLVRIRTKDYPSNKKYKNHWILEQCANISLIFLIPAAFLTENKHVDMAMGSAVILHSYWGVQSIVKDYVRSDVVGKPLSTVTKLLVVIVSLTALTGLYQLVYDDIGIANTIKKFWLIKGAEEKKEVKKVAYKRKWYEWKKD